MSSVFGFSVDKEGFLGETEVEVDSHIMKDVSLEEEAEEIEEETFRPIHETAKLHTLEEQRELFLWKFPEVSRVEVTAMLKDFRRYDMSKKNGLDYYELMLLMEYRGCVMSAMEIMGMVGNEYHDSHTRLSFVEWLCAYFMKDYQEMFVYVNDSGKLEEAMKYSEEARRLEEEMKRDEEMREMRASIRAAALERESKLVSCLVQLMATSLHKLIVNNFDPSRELQV
jgi:hypothetical protein